MRVEISEKVYGDLSLLSQAWGVSESDAVERLIASFRGANVSAGAGTGTNSGPSASQSGLVPVHADYDGIRVAGEYDPTTQSIRIIDGIKARRLYKSPSGAAIAVVSELNPTVNPNRNGWGFWTVTETGQLLQQIRRR